MSKASLLGIVKDHFSTLRDNSIEEKENKNKETKWKILWADLVLQIIFPLALGVLSFVLGFTLTNGIGGLITAVSIVAALMCAMAVMVFQIRMQMKSDKLFTLGTKKLINEVFSNIMWTIVVGLFLAAYLAIFEALGLFDQELAGRILTAVAAAISFHFIMLIAMCLKRLRSAYNTVAARKG